MTEAETFSFLMLSVIGILHKVGARAFAEMGVGKESGHEETRGVREKA